MFQEYNIALRFFQQVLVGTPPWYRGSAKGWQYCSDGVIRFGPEEDDMSDSGYIILELPDGTRLKSFLSDTKGSLVGWTSLVVMQADRHRDFQTLWQPQALAEGLEVPQVASMPPLRLRVWQAWIRDAKGQSILGWKWSVSDGTRRTVGSARGKSEAKWLAVAASLRV